MVKRILTVFLVCALIAGMLPLTPIEAQAAGDVVINGTNFPDANFRKYVKETFDTAENGGGAGDGILTAAEIGKISKIDCNYMKIANLKGIEHFTALTYLNCKNNYLLNLDVSKNTALTELDCWDNQLTSLDVSKNTALTVLSCGLTQLTNLDVSKNTALTYLDCGSNDLTSLDVSKNTALTYLCCGSNDLTSLDVSNNKALTELYCGYSELTSLDVSKNTALTSLDCYRNKLTSLDVSKNTALTILECYDNQLTSLDVSKNTALTYLRCSYNQLTSLDVSNNKALTYLDCSDNPLTSLDVSKNTALTTLGCSGNQLTSLDVSKNMALWNLQCDDNQLTSLDVSKNTTLTYFGCDGQLPTLPLKISSSGSKYIVDLNQIRSDLGDRGFDVSRVSMDDGGVLSPDGKVTYDSSPTKIVYNYDTKRPSETTLMDVTITIGDPGTPPPTTPTPVYTINFDANGGSFNGIQVQTFQTNASGKLDGNPNKPEYAGYYFKGWYDENGNAFTDTTYTKDTTYKAKWEKSKYAVTFDANGGTMKFLDLMTYMPYEKSTVIIYTDKDGKLHPLDFPPKPEYAGVKKFGGWQDDTGKIIDYDNYDVKAITFSKNTTLIAKWIGPDYSKIVKLPFEFAHENAQGKTVKDTRDCYYSDNYFSNSSTTYNHNLATASLCLAMSSFASINGYETQSENAQDLLLSMGFDGDKIFINEEYKKKPSEDSIGVIIGSKELSSGGKDYTLVAVSIRGAGYESEWAGNFKIGKSGNHAGFSAARDQVLRAIGEYVNKYKIEGNVKIWITGYSRAGATANLTAAKLVDDFSVAGKALKKEDIYAYTFETPAGANVGYHETREKYNNIFNILNPADFVPLVAPSYFVFGRHGRDMYLPSNVNTNVNEKQQRDTYGYMLKEFKSLRGEYLIDDFKKVGSSDIGNLVNMARMYIKGKFGALGLSELADAGTRVYESLIRNIFVKKEDRVIFDSQGFFLDETISRVAKAIGSRSKYTEDLEYGIPTAVELIMRRGSDVWKAIKNNKWEGIALLLVDGVALRGPTRWRGPTTTIADIHGGMSKQHGEYLRKCVRESGMEYDLDRAYNAGTAIGELLYKLMEKGDNVPYALDVALNGDSIKQGHFAELCFAWMTAMDSNYAAKGETRKPFFSANAFKYVSVNCNVDVDVFDKNGRHIASIINEEPVEVADGFAPYGIDGNGQKFFVVPADEEYTVKIKAREDDSVNVAIKEHCAAVNDYTRVVNYFDVAVKKGEVLTAVLPEFTQAERENDIPDGSSAVYTLTRENGEKISASSDLTGEKALNAYYDIDVVSSSDDYGMVIGSGVHQYGDFAQICAIENEGGKFVGWYKDGKQVSAEKDYRFKVTENGTYEAKFDEAPKPPSDSTGGGGGGTKPTPILPSPTGDENRAAIWLIAMLISALGIVIFAAKKLKQNR